MTNRYCNLTPSKQIKDDFGNITLGFDGVQNEMDGRIATDQSLQTQITSHLNAAVAHAAAQIQLMAISGMTATDLQAAIAELSVRIANIVAGSGSSNTEIVDARLGADGVVRATLGTLVREIHAKLLTAAIQTLAAKFGWNYLLTDQASPLDYVFSGRTLVNIPGKAGGFESLSGWTLSGLAPTLSTAQVRAGATSLKVANTASIASYVYQDISYPLDTAKQYVLAGWVYIESRTTGSFPTISLYDVGTFTSRYAAVAVATVGSWQFVYIKIPTANTLVGSGFRLFAGLGGVGDCVAYIDSVRLYELSTADYNAIGTTYTASTSPSIDDFIPYVDSFKHLSGMGLRLTGKNLLPPFTDAGWALTTNAVVTDAYKMTLNATAAFQISQVEVPVISGSSYVFSKGASNGDFFMQWKSASGTYTSLNGGAAIPNGTVLAAPSTAVAFRVQASSQLAGTFTFVEPMLVLGSSTLALPPSFEPQNNDYAYADIKLASNVDGSVRDTFDSRLGMVTRRWKTDLAIDNSVSVGTITDLVGFKQITFPFSGVVTNSVNLWATKHNGSLLTSVTGATAADQTYIGAANTSITVADTDSGWGEAYVPSSAEVSAYFLGWRLNNGTFGTPYNGSGTKTWTATNATSNTGAVTTVPTTASSAITSGAYDYYRLSYQLATTTTEAIVPEGSLSSHNGGNQFECLSGVIPREKATPALSGSNYYINASNIAGTNLKNRAERIIAVYKNGVVDKKWVIQDRSLSGDAYGKVRATIAAADYDPTAEYTVTYQALDRYLLTTNPVDMTIYYNTNPKTVLDSLVQDMADVQTTSSINARAVAELYKRVKALGG